jgi:lipoprotein NlpD
MMNDAMRGITVVAIALVAGCTTQRPAPVVDRSAATTARAPLPPPPSAVQPARAAKDGVYVVQPGDTLYSIALSFGVDVRDLARWNDVADAAALRVGQPLRVTPPAEVATVTPVTPGGSTEVRPLPAPGAEAGAPTPMPPPVTPAPVPPTSPSTTAVPPVVVDAAALGWVWPVSGNVIDGFDAPRNKGIDIAGVEGAPVQAAADGEVVHVGSALRGYGNLVIIRHPGEFVTAYGHNRRILVAQGQQVKRGQQIAELGRSDADRPKLHFEIRHQGKPLDPVKYLPPR